MASDYRSPSDIYPSLTYNDAPAATRCSIPRTTPGTSAITGLARIGKIERIHNQ